MTYFILKRGMKATLYIALLNVHKQKIFCYIPIVNLMHPFDKRIIKGFYKLHAFDI